MRASICYTASSKVVPPPQSLVAMTIRTGGRGAGEAPFPPAAAKSEALSKNNRYKASRSFLSTPLPKPGT